MINNLSQIASGGFWRKPGETFIEYSREDMMEMAEYALNPTKTNITGEQNETK